MNPPSREILPAWLWNFQSLLLFVFDRDGIIQQYSSSFQKKFLATHASAGNIHLNNAFDKKNVAQLLISVADISRQEKDRRSTQFITLPDKEDNLFICEYSCIFRTQSGKDLFVGIITQDEEIARLIEYNKEWIDAFFNNSPGSAWVTNEAGEMLLMNSVSRELVGLGNDYKNKTLWDIYPKHMADVFFENNRQVLETNEMLVTEENFIDKYGRSRISMVYKFPLKTKNNKRLIGGWSIDITERKKAEQKINRHNLKIKELAFLQSHEVRRPLANILGLIQLIHSDEKNFAEDDLMRLLDYIKTSAFELDDIIKKVIDKLREE